MESSTISLEVGKDGELNKRGAESGDSLKNEQVVKLRLYSRVALNVDIVLRTVLINMQRGKIVRLNNEIAFLKWTCVVMTLDRLFSLLYALLNLSYLFYFAPYYLHRSERWF